MSKSELIEKFNNSHLLLLVMAALITSYLLLLWRKYLWMDYLASLPSILGIVAVWLAVKKWRVNEVPILREYHIDQPTLAFGLGGTLAGLPVLVLFGRSTNDVFLLIVIMAAAGQIFWLIWPAAALKGLWRHRSGVVEFGGVIQVIIAILGGFGLLPGFNFAMSFVFLILFSYITSLFGINL